MRKLTIEWKIRKIKGLQLSRIKILILKKKMNI
jgi:hypothetical protein